MTGGGRMKVFVRVRPPSAQELAAAPVAVQVHEDAAVVRVRSNSEIKEFGFDGAFAGGATQSEVFLEAGLPVVRNCLNGINGTILAYGQTGSGKTHSLLSQGADDEDWGLLPRIVFSLFVQIARDEANVYEVEAGALQVYNEEIDDLLHGGHRSGGNSNLGVQKGGVVPGLTWVPCRHPDDMLDLFARARANIVYAETKMNKGSSRSHAVMQIRVSKRARVRAVQGGQRQRVELKRSRLCIVDLAGSERMKKSGAEGLRLREANRINQSLLALGNVMSALARRKPHVPMRDSKLTRVLEGSLGGGCKTVLLICCGPSVGSAQETINTLEFAARAMSITVSARVNTDIVEVDAQSLLRDLRQDPRLEALRQATGRAAEWALPLENSGAESPSGRRRGLPHGRLRVEKLRRPLGAGRQPSAEDLMKEPTKEEAEELRRAASRLQESAAWWRSEAAAQEAAVARAQEAADESIACAEEIRRHAEESEEVAEGWQRRALDAEQELQEFLLREDRQLKQALSDLRGELEAAAERQRGDAEAREAQLRAELAQEQLRAEVREREQGLRQELAEALLASRAAQEAAAAAQQQQAREELAHKAEAAQIAAMQERSKSAVAEAALEAQACRNAMASAEDRRRIEEARAAADNARHSAAAAVEEAREARAAALRAEAAGCRSHASSARSGVEAHFPLPAFLFGKPDDCLERLLDGVVGGKGASDPGPGRAQAARAFGAEQAVNPPRLLASDGAVRKRGVRTQWAEQYARWLGVDPVGERVLFELLTADERLPDGWTLQVDKLGRTYFWNRVTEESLWTHPDHEIFNAVIKLCRHAWSQSRPAAILRRVLTKLRVDGEPDTQRWSGPYLTDGGLSRYWHDAETGVSCWQDPGVEERRRHDVRSRLLITLLEDAERRCEEDGARTPEGACGLHNTAVLMGCDGSDDDGQTELWAPSSPPRALRPLGASARRRPRAGSAAPLALEAPRPMSARALSSSLPPGERTREVAPAAALSARGLGDSRPRQVAISPQANGDVRLRQVSSLGSAGRTLLGLPSVGLPSASGPRREAPTDAVPEPSSPRRAGSRPSGQPRSSPLVAAGARLTQSQSSQGVEKPPEGPRRRPGCRLGGA